MLTNVASGFRLSSKPLLTSDAYELGAGMRKRHKGPEEEHDALVGTGTARGRSQPWDEHEASSDFMSQVSNPVFEACCHVGRKVRRMCGVHTPFVGLLALLLYRNEKWMPSCPSDSPPIFLLVRKGKL